MIKRTMGRVGMAAILGVTALTMGACSKAPAPAEPAAAAVPPAEPIPRAESTPNTPKNWAGPAQKINAQVLVDEIIAGHPEVMSVTVHANPPGADAEIYTMIAGSFPDRIGNQSSPGDVITAKKGVSQVESKWGTKDWKQKVSIVLPLKDTSGNYLPVAMVIAFKTSEEDKRIDTDFLAPGLAIRNGFNSRIADVAWLFAPAG